MPAAPTRKQAIKVQAAAFGEKPPLMRDDLEDGSMLYSEEKSCRNVSSIDIPFHLNVPTMTPKLRLNDDERNALLSWILKHLHESSGIWQINRSTQTIKAPSMHAINVLAVGPNKRTLVQYTDAAQSSHYPSSSIITKDHLAVFTLSKWAKLKPGARLARKEAR